MFVFGVVIGLSGTVNLEMELSDDVSMERPRRKENKKAKAVTVSFHESSLLHAKISYVKGAGVDGVQTIFISAKLEKQKEEEEKRRLEEMSEDEYDALTEEEKAEVDKKHLEQKKERRKRELERQEREKKEKELQALEEKRLEEER